MNKIYKKLKFPAGVLIAIIAFFALLQFSPCLAKKEKPLSEIIKEGTPTVGQEAASVAREENQKTDAASLVDKNHCQTLPENMWILMFGAYLFLLVFNLTYGTEKEKGVRWFWEALYTILALLAWEGLDECRTNSWFPKTAIITFVIIYLCYLYYFNNKIIRKEKEKDRTLPLDLK